ncbi:MAG TPA: ATP-binding protein [Candidatus Acidoferrales bacterium]
MPVNARVWRYLLTGLVYAAIYIALDYVSVGLQITPGVSAWYPPSALSLALFAGVSFWYVPWVFLVGIVAQVLNYNQPITSASSQLSTLTVTLGYACAAFFVRKCVRMDKTFHQVREVGRFITLAALTAAGVAMIGSAALAIDHTGAKFAYWSTVFTWWVGDTVALVSVAPFLFLFVLPWLRSWLGMPSEARPESWYEDPAFESRVASWRSSTIIACQFLTAAFVLYLVFGTRLNERYDLFYLCFVPVIWIAASGGAKRSVVGLLFINTGAVVAIRYAHAAAAISFSELQLLMLVISVTGISLGAAVDERTSTEKKLQGSTLYLNSLIENSPLALVSHDVRGKILMVNAAFERLFAYPETEILGKTLDPLITPPGLEKETNDITLSLSYGVPVHVVTKRARSTGDMVNVELYGVPLFANGSVKGGYGIYKDITDQKKMETELALSQKLQAVGRLAGGMAHDFNNILGVIQGYSEYLMERMDRGNPLRESAEEILNSAHRGSGLIRQLLSFSRKQTIELVVLDLNKVVSNVKHVLERLIGDDIELQLTLGSDQTLIKADSGQIEQIILNLAVNARDAMPEGGKITIETLNTSLERAPSQRPEPFVMMSFSDSGTGMDQETQNHIFEPFFTTKEKGKGTGLGLCTVYGIVEQSGGQIQVFSEIGHGTTFRIYFPREQSIEEAPTLESKTLRASGGHETILLVEDQNDFRRMTASYLERSGYKVLVARNSAEAIATSAANREPIHLLLTDVVMPGMRGPQLAKALAPSRPDMAILFMSGYTDGSIDEETESTSGFALIHKPFTWNLLASKMREALDGRTKKTESGKTLGIGNLTAI